MYDLAPAHALGLIGGLITLAAAIFAVRRSPWHRSSPATVQIGAVLMAVGGGVHLALVPTIWSRLLRPRAGVETPDQLAIATKLVELAALGMVLVSLRGQPPRSHRALRWFMLGVAVPALALVTASVASVPDLVRPTVTHVHASARAVQRLVPGLGRRVQTGRFDGHAVNPLVQHLPRGGIDVSTAPMLHVWIVGNPKEDRLRSTSIRRWWRRSTAADRLVDSGFGALHPFCTPPGKAEPL